MSLGQMVLFLYLLPSKVTSENLFNVETENIKNCYRYEFKYTILKLILGLKKYPALPIWSKRQCWVRSMILVTIIH
jgi:hypothetical protein